MMMRPIKRSSILSFSFSFSFSSFFMFCFSVTSLLFLLSSPRVRYADASENGGDSYSLSTFSIVEVDDEEEPTLLGVQVEEEDYEAVKESLAELLKLQGVPTPPFEFAFDANYDDVVDAKIALFNQSWCPACKGPSDEDKANWVHSHGNNTVMAMLGTSDVCFACGYAFQAISAYQVGARGFMYDTDGVAGHGVRIKHSFGDQRRAKEINFPSVMVARDNTKNLKKLLDGSKGEKQQKITGELVRVDLRPSRNEWLDHWDSAAWQVLWRGFLSLQAFVIAVFAAVRMGLIFRAKKFSMPVPLASLGLLIIACMIRGVITAGDPVFSTGNFSYSAARFLLTLHVDFDFLAALLLALSWNDVVISTRKGKKIGNGKLLSSSSKKKFVAAGAIIFAIDIIFICLMAYAGMGRLVLANGLVMAVISFWVGISFTYYGRKIIRETREVLGTQNTPQRKANAQSSGKDPGIGKGKGKGKKESSGNKKNSIVRQLERMSRLILQTGAWTIFVGVVIVLIGIVPNSFNIPIVRSVLWWLLAFGMNMAAITKILAFQVPRSAVSDTQQGSSSGTGKETNSATPNNINNNNSNNNNNANINNNSNSNTVTSQQQHEQDHTLATSSFEKLDPASVTV